MNERIKELAEQAGFGYDDLEVDRTMIMIVERFAELVRQNEAKACAEHYLGIMRDAVEQAVLKEREACAKLCEDMAEEGSMDGHALKAAEAIRARSEK